MSLEKEVRKQLSESGVNMKKLDQLVRQGMMSPAQLPMLHRGLGKLQSGKTMNPQERDAVNKVVQSMMFIVTGDDTVFQKAKQHTQKNRYQTEEVGEETVSEESPAEDKLSSSYKAKFAAMLKKTGKSLKDMSDDEKKAFFTKVDGAHDAKDESVEEGAMSRIDYQQKSGEKGSGLETFKKKPAPKAPKDTLVASPKTQRVKRTTAAAAKKMVSKGAVYAEDAVNEEDKTHIVQYHTKDGTHKNDSRVMTKAKATDHAKRGNMIDKVGGKYTVKAANEETVEEGYTDSEDMRAKAEKKAARTAKKVAGREKATDPGIKEDARSDARRAMRSDSRGMAPLKKDKKTTHTGTKAGEERHGGHIVMQLRKAVSIGKPVKFKDGKEHKISKADAHKFLSKYNTQKPADREKMHSGHDSHDSFQSHINNK